MFTVNIIPTLPHIKKSQDSYCVVFPKLGRKLRQPNDSMSAVLSLYPLSLTSRNHTTHQQSGNRVVSIQWNMFRNKYCIFFFFCTRNKTISYGLVKEDKL